MDKKLAEQLTKEANKIIDERAKFMYEGYLYVREAYKNKYLPMIRDGLQRITDVMRHMLTYARSGNVTNTEACPTHELIDSF